MEIFPTTKHFPSMKKMLEKLIDKEGRPDRVGLRIAAIRQAKGMTKAEFADSIRLDRSSMTKVEAGAMGLDIAVAMNIASLYGAGLNFIYRRDLTDLQPTLLASVLKNLEDLEAAR